MNDISMQLLFYVLLLCSLTTILSTQTVMFWALDGEWRFPTSLRPALGYLIQSKAPTAVSEHTHYHYRYKKKEHFLSMLCYHVKVFQI